MKRYKAEPHKTNKEEDNMNITITVDDRTPAGRRILDEARRARKGVHVHNPAEGGCPPRAT